MLLKTAFRCNQIACFMMAVRPVGRIVDNSIQKYDSCFIGGHMIPALPVLFDICRQCTQ